MPLYEYRCTACSDRFEEFRPVDAEPPACPACGGASERVFTAPNTEWKPGNVRWDALPSRGFDP
jgi:putative FmdB family regulatory protein